MKTAHALVLCALLGALALAVAEVSPSPILLFVQVFIGVFAL
jgi:hypothetical protein